MKMRLGEKRGFVTNLSGMPILSPQNGRSRLFYNFNIQNEKPAVCGQLLLQ